MENCWTACWDGGEKVPCVFGTNAPPATLEGPGEDTAILNQAITALHAGDIKQAGQLATLAGRQNPTNAQAAYVARIIDREQNLPAAPDSRAAH